ncbi:MAG: BTAD domain-containing putative transcriptional regulator [Candidatus Eisenbacteria bacterium]
MLFRAKLQPPNIDPAMLERPALLAELERHAGCALTLVTADAGWGKSSLAVAFARRVHRPVVWYALLPSDADLKVFGRHLAEGFRTGAPRFGGPFLRLLEETRPGGRGADALAEAFAQALSELKGPPRLLVLDDLHAVAGSAEVVAFLDTLLRMLPPTVRVLATTRSGLPLSLERMRVRGELAELDAARLRFTREEMAGLTLERLGREGAAAEVERLEAATAGWPTAVHLALDAMRREPERPLESVLGELGMADVQLQAFFSAEVYRRLEPEARHLLECTTTLDRFDAPLAAALSGQPDVRKRLERLVRRGLLRSFGTGAEGTFEWHGLVRSFVRQEIESTEGAQGWRAREAQTARALRARGESERALRHALDACEAEDAAELLTALAPGMLAQGRGTSLLAFLQDLPTQVVANHIALASARADALASLGRWDEAELEYERALTRARELRDGVRECSALLGLGKVLNLRGRHEQVLGMAERGLAAEEGLTVAQRARLLQMKASAHFYLGQNHAAIALLDQVRALLPADAEPELVLPTLHNLAVAYASQGRYREAVGPLREALARVRGTSSPRAPLYLSNLAFVLFEIGDLVEARRSAEEGLAAAQQFANRAQEATCREALAEVLAQTGDLDGALAELKHAETLHEQLRMEVITADLLAARGRIFCLRGQYRRAAEFLTRAIERASERPDGPRLVAYRAQLAWCELRAGRPHAAVKLLADLVPAADRGDNEDEKMRVHWWMAEALLAVGEAAKARPHLSLALALVRERGYAHFLRQRARENGAPLVEALAHGIEVDACADALVEAGRGSEDALLEVADKAPVAAAEAAIAVLGETGGEASRERLPLIARRRRSLVGAIKASMTHVESRTRRETAPDGAPPPRLVLFGPPRLEIGGRTLPASAWRAQRAFHVLLLLSLRLRGATREELLEMFWPGRRLAAGKRNFHPTLSYIRSVLPRHSGPPLLREAELYRLNPDYPLQCDVWEFEDALEAARRPGDETDRLQHLEHALRLAEQPALEGIYEAWAEEAQHRLRDRVETASLSAGRIRQRAGQAEEALVHFRRASGIDEFRESTRVHVVECLVATGNRAAAMAEIERVRTILRKELAVDPLPETAEGFRRALGAPVRDFSKPTKPLRAFESSGSVKSSSSGRG